jgi:CheY-like chemotaxis protein
MTPAPAHIIMIVEDNAINLKLTSDLLELEGFDVHRCTDAESALQTLEEVHPDLILMDVALPGIDGLSLTRKLKSDEQTRYIKIIALTAFAMKSDKDRVLAAGCDGYITKPIDTRKFGDQIKKFLPSNP